MIDGRERLEHPQPREESCRVQHLEQAAIASLAITREWLPPTLNLDNPSPSCDIDLVPKKAKERRVRYALSNSFGFGGTNASLIFSGPG